MQLITRKHSFYENAIRTNRTVSARKQRNFENQTLVTEIVKKCVHVTENCDSKGRSERAESENVVLYAPLKRLSVDVVIETYENVRGCLSTTDVRRIGNENHLRAQNFEKN